jgi:hypothetical protein
MDQVTGVSVHPSEWSSKFDYLEGNMCLRYMYGFGLICIYIYKGAGAMPQPYISSSYGILRLYTHIYVPRFRKL